MAPPPQINADVFDIRKHVPASGETFVVDTNVWKWVAYTKMSMSASPRPQAISYPAFVQLARAKGATLFHCGLSLSELSNVVERDEFSQYAQVRNLATGDRERKTFRRDPWERGKVTAEINAAWQQVQALSSLITISVDGSTTAACLKHLTTCMIDAYDGFLVEAAVAAGAPQILTDDVDLSSVPGIRVFTSHPVVLMAAKAAGRLKN